MNRISVTENDLGFDWYRFLDEPYSIEDYIHCLEKVRLVFECDEWRSAVTGGYASYIWAPDGMNAPAIRICGYVGSSSDTSRILEEICRVHSLCERNGERPSPPSRKPSHFEDSRLERRFRTYLSTYTMIAFDVVRNDWAAGRNMSVALRSHGTLDAQLAERVCKPVFTANSEFFREMAIQDQHALWHDIAYPYSESLKADWVHFLINLILPSDPGYRDIGGMKDWLLEHGYV